MLLLSILLPISILILVTKLSLHDYPLFINSSDEFCLKGNFFLPDLYNIQSLLPVNKTYKKSKYLYNGYPIFTKEICFTPQELLPEAKNYNIVLFYTQPFHLPIFTKTINIESREYPKIKNILFDNEINKEDVLAFQLDRREPLIEYSLNFNGDSVLCTKNADFVICDTSPFSFEYSETYEIVLISKYNDDLIEQLDSQTLTILDPVKIVDSSIKNNDVLKNPTNDEIVLILNKEILPHSKTGLCDSEENIITTEVEYNSSSISIFPLDSFEQGHNYILEVDNIIGVDNSEMEREYVLEFSIDSGPKIVSSNIKNGFSTTNNIIMTFDQDLDESQNIKNLISLDSKTNYSYTISNRKVIINPHSNLSFCKNHNLTINKGVKSNTGLISTNEYTYTFKTSCKRTYSIGKSVEGRTIYSYYLGNGSKKIIFYAAMHGSESNTRSTLMYWISELENNIDRIPDDKTVIVIPSLNPDGVYNGTRFNSNGVDINRNFDSSTWTTGTYFLSRYYPNGGGDKPFSEPETRAIRDIILREKPYLTISYHSAAGYVIPSNTNKGIDLGRVYSNLSGYRYIAPGTEGSFSYDITGAFGEWAQENGYNSLTIELSSAYNSQFSQNKNAMWEMVKR